MGFSDISLPGSVIADLYKQSLVQAGPQQEAPPAPEATTTKTVPGGNNYKFLGNNQRQVAIIVAFDEETFLPDEHLQFLTKMLEACKLNLGDVAIINHAKKEVDIDLLKEQLRPSNVLLFGVEPVAIKLPLNFPHFKDQAFAGISYLYTPALETLNLDSEEGKLLKSKLWVCLRKLFKV
jgi:hypothetical protein